MSGSITIGDRTWELTPFKGLASIRKLPKVISFASKLIQSAITGGLPVDKWISGVQAGTLDIVDALSAIDFVADTLGDSFKEFETEIVPYILQVDAKFLAENGTPRELISALITAIQFHLETSFGADVRDALKNLETAEETAEEQQTN